jgi:hypothetical protein
MLKTMTKKPAVSADNSKNPSNRTRAKIMYGVGYE